MLRKILLIQCLVHTLNLMPSPIAFGQKTNVPNNAASNAGEIVAVTLYRSQAMVTRSIDVPAGNGEREVLIGRLPERVVVDSVFGEGSSEIEVRGVRVTEKAEIDSERGEVKTISDRLQAIQLEIQELNRQVLLVSKKRQYIDQLMSFSIQGSHTDLNRGVLDAVAVTELAEYSMQQQTELNASEAALQLQMNQLLQEQSLLNRRLSLLTESNGVVHEARMTVFSADNQGGKVKLSYLVSGCSWTPQYTIRGSLGADEFSLKYSALVEQMSGEDWKKVKLVLSTASPNISAAGPMLTAYRVRTIPSAGYGGYGGAAGSGGGYGDDPFGDNAAIDNDMLQQKSASLRVKQQQVEAEFAAKHRDEDNLSRNYALNSLANEVQELELQADSKLLKTLASDVADEVASQTYALDQPVSLDSRKEQQLVQVIDAQLDGELYHVATPLLSSFAYREADIINSRPEGFLRGEATIYLDDRFVGRTEIPSTASGQHLIVGFGADQQVRTRRELLEKTDTVRGGNRLLEFGYRLVVANFKSQPVALRLIDRYPLADQSSEVSVKMLDTHYPLSEDGLYARVQKTRGILRWDLEIPAEQFGEKAFDVDYRYSVEFARNQQLSSLVGNETQLESQFYDATPAAMGMGGGGGFGGMGGMGGGMGSPAQQNSPARQQ